MVNHTSQKKDIAENAHDFINVRQGGLNLTRHKINTLKVFHRKER